MATFLGPGCSLREAIKRLAYGKSGESLICCGENPRDAGQGGNQLEAALGAGSWEGRQASTLCRTIGWRRSPAKIAALTLPRMAPAKFASPASTSSSGKKGPIVDRTFEIEFLDHGVQALDFTFG